MEYRNENESRQENEQNRRGRTRNAMDEMEDRGSRRGGNNGGNRSMHMSMGGGRMSGRLVGLMENHGARADESQVEELYALIDERMCQALDFHSQLADYFCFLGLQGFKRMCEYQYMKECAEMRKMHRRYIDHHNRVLPVRDIEKPDLIPKDWARYTTKDIDDSVVPKFVRMALTEWYEWEKESKEILEEICQQMQDMGLHADVEYVKDCIVDGEKECKKVMRLYEQLNGTGYDATAIHGMQDKYHEKYKKKYNDRFTMKNNYNQYGRSESWEQEGRSGRRRIGYV